MLQHSRDLYHLIESWWTGHCSTDASCSWRKKLPDGGILRSGWVLYALILPTPQLSLVIDGKALQPVSTVCCSFLFNYYCVTLSQAVAKLLTMWGCLLSSLLHEKNQFCDYLMAMRLAGALHVACIKVLLQSIAILILLYREQYASACVRCCLPSSAKLEIPEDMALITLCIK